MILGAFQKWLESLWVNLFVEYPFVYMHNFGLWVFRVNSNFHIEYIQLHGIMISLAKNASS